jgi:hypothetical protein
VTTYSNKHAIFNIAAALLGQEAVTSPDTAVDRLGRSLNAHFDGVVAEVCQSFDWPCARKRAQLIAEATSVTLPNPFKYRYPMPSDYLRLLDGETDHINYAIELDENDRLVLLADDAIGYITYARVPLIDRFDPLLCAAIGAKLAERIALIVTESESRAEKLMEKAQRALDLAVSGAMFERSPDIDDPSTWKQRMYGGG